MGTKKDILSSEERCDQKSCLPSSFFSQLPLNHICAGGFEGQNGELSALIQFIGLTEFLFFPIATIRGEYSFGAYSALQIPLVLIILIFCFFVFRFSHKKSRLLWLPLIYILSIIGTNLLAQPFRVDHSNDFPRTRIIDLIDWRRPPSADRACNPNWRSRSAICRLHRERIFAGIGERRNGQSGFNASASASVFRYRMGCDSNKARSF